MASIRKRYRDQGLELDGPELDDDDGLDKDDGPQVSAAPADSVKPAPEHISAPQPQPQQITPQMVEQTIANAPLPEVAKDWLRRHPEFVFDKDKSAEINKHHESAKYLAGGEQFTQKYIDKMEEILGLRSTPRQEEASPPKPNGHLPPPRPAAQPAQPQQPRQQPQQQQPQYRGQPPSAPPTRQAPSMTTGRPAASPTQLTPAQQEIVNVMAASNPQWTRAECEQRYKEGLARMMKEKQEGFHNGC